MGDVLFEKDCAAQHPDITGGADEAESVSIQVGPLIEEKKLLGPVGLRDSPSEDIFVFKNSKHGYPVEGSSGSLNKGGVSIKSGLGSGGPSHDMGLVNVPAVQGEVGLADPNFVSPTPTIKTGVF